MKILGCGSVGLYRVYFLDGADCAVDINVYRVLSIVSGVQCVLKSAAHSNWSA